MADTDILYDNLTFIEKRVSVLEEQVALLVQSLDTQKKKAKKDTNSKMLLECAKADFLDNDPEKRTDPFTDFELVFWASYVLKDTERRERLSSWSEVGKRAKKIKALIQFFREKYCQHLQGEGLQDALARDYTKQFLKYFLIQFPYIGEGTNRKYNNFWIATSDWAVNNYSQNITVYRQIQNLADESLD